MRDHAVDVGETRSTSSRTTAGQARPEAMPTVHALVYGAMGMAPITALALSLLEIIPLHIGGPILVGGAFAIGLLLVVLVPNDRPAVLRGLLAGIAAVSLYDCTRMPFVFIGDWPDFIPKIGAWLIDEPEAHWSLGYLWRYIGNGGGMGLTFAMLAPTTDRLVSRLRAGPLYGVAVWTGLVLTVVLSPDGQDKMFPLTPATLAVTLTGHLVYGTVLGLALQRRSLGSSRTPLQRAGFGWVKHAPQ